MKIPFTLDAWLQDMSRKVVDEDGGSIDPRVCTLGWLLARQNKLFIVTPEEEMTEWQRFISACLQKHGLLDCGAADRIAKESAAEFLAIAREQFIKDGYVIEKKAFHDAVENISDKHRAEMSVEYSLHCKVEDGTRHAIINWNEFQKVAQHFIDCGKAEALRTRATELTKNLNKSGLDKDSIPYHLIEFMCNLYDCQNWKEIEETAELYVPRLKAAALKDLPRWEKSQFEMDDPCVNFGWLQVGKKMIYIPDLEKLPGFKED